MKNIKIAAKLLAIITFLVTTTSTANDRFSTMVNGSGTWSAATGLVYLPKEEVKKALPKKLKLISSFSEQEGKHPVLFMFGLQENVKSKFNSWIFPPYFAPYLEFILAIPGVTSTDSAEVSSTHRPHIFLPLLYLDRFYPVWVGKEFFGYNKIKVKMQQNNQEYFVSRKKINNNASPTILSAKWISTENIKYNWKQDEQLVKVNSYLEQPVISIKRNKVRCFPFSWQIEGSNEIQRIKLQFNIGSDFPYSFTKRNYVLKNKEQLAFYYKKSWKNHLPISCNEL